MRWTSISRLKRQVLHARDDMIIGEENAPSEADPFDDPVEPEFNKPAVSKLGDLGLLVITACRGECAEPKDMSGCYSELRLAWFLPTAYNVPVKAMYRVWQQLTVNSQWRPEMDEAAFISFLRAATQQLADHSIDGSVHFIYGLAPSLRNDLGVQDHLHRDEEPLCLEQIQWRDGIALSLQT